MARGNASHDLTALERHVRGLSFFSTAFCDWGGSMIDISLIEFFQDLTNPHLDFLPRAVGISILAAIVCGVVGCYVVLRGMSFIGDAVSHAVFPGPAIAFVFQGSVLLGGAVAGCTVAVLIAFFSQRRTVREDSVIGIFFAAAFALGMVIISRVDGYTASLTSFLFGSLTGVSRADLYTAFTVTVLIVATVLLLGPQLTATCLDKETARAMGLPVFALDIVLSPLVHSRRASASTSTSHNPKETLSA